MTDDDWQAIEDDCRRPIPETIKQAIDRHLAAHPAPASASEPEPRGPHDGSWSVFNSGGACVIENVTYQLAADYMTADRMARGWTMVSIIKSEAELIEARPASSPASGASTEVQAPIPQARGEAQGEAVGGLYQHSETGRTRVVMNDAVADCDASWLFVGDLVLKRPAPPASASTASLPHPGSPEASAMMDSLLAEYQHPANPKNAARAGWEAASRWLATPTPTPAPEARKPLTRQEAAKRWAELTAEMEILAPLLGMRRIQPSDVDEESAPTPAPEAMLSDMDRAVLTMPADIAFAGEMAQLQYHARVQSLLNRIDAGIASPSGAEGGERGNG